MKKENHTKNWNKMKFLNLILVFSIFFLVPNIFASTFQIEWNSAPIAPETWTLINLSNNYQSPIIVATPEYSATTNDNGISTWITNVTSNSFMLRISDENFAAADTINVHYMAIEKGSWVIPGSTTKIEAGELFTNKVGSSSTGWTCPSYGETITFSNTFDSNPLVLSTRGSNNNPNSWANTFQNDPSSSGKTVTTTQMCLGLSQSKATSPGAITNNETIYWIAVDEGNGYLGGVEYEILWNLQDTGDSGGNWINGYADAKPFTQSWAHSWLGSPNIIIASQTSVAGSDGSWPVIYDTGNTASIRMFVDEANERAHSGSESGGGWAFNNSGSYGNFPPNNVFVNFTKQEILIDENNTINATITDINGNNTILNVTATIISPNSTSYNISLNPEIIDENLTSDDAETSTKNYTAISDGEIIGEAGSINLYNRTSKIIHFTQIYNQTPVIIAIVDTQNNDDSPFIPVIHSINRTDAVISLCRDNGAITCDNNYLTETVDYAIFDINKSNNYSWIEVSNISTLTDGSAKSFSFSKTFANAPYIWALPQTYNINSVVTDGIAGQSWFTSITTTGANIVGCDHPGTGDSCAGTATENYGYVAIDVNDQNIKDFASGTQSISGSSWTGISFSRTYNDPKVFVMVNSEAGAQDPKYPWAKNIDSSGADIRYCEADGANYCDTHNAETTNWFSVESGPIGVGNGGDDIEKNITIITYSNLFSETTHNITKIKLNINITKFNNSASIARGNNNPDLEIELGTGLNSFKSIGLLNISGNKLYSVNITDPEILEAWQTKSNRNIKVSAVNFDYYSSTEIDYIYWNLTNVDVDYRTYTSKWFNNFSNTQVCGVYNLTNLYSYDNQGALNNTIYNNINFSIPCGPVINLLFPINYTKLLTDDKVNFTWYIKSGSSNLTCQLFINSNLNQTFNCTSFENNSINLKLGSGYFNWTINATDEINLSTKVPVENFINILNSQSYISKSINLISSDLFKIKIKLKNNINASRLITPLDFVQNKFNSGSFNLIYDWLNITNSIQFKGSILGWNLSLNSFENKEINYSITKNSDDYKLKKEFVIGLD